MGAHRAVGPVELVVHEQLGLAGGGGVTQAEAVGDADHLVAVDGRHVGDGQ
jgi:hypothetical protein